MAASRGDLDPNAFEIHRRVVRDDAEIAYVHEGVGGVPLLLLHGYPVTKRLFWRNIRALADAGFEVIAPDHRGSGDSPPASKVVDIVTSSRDMQALVTQLGHERIVIAGGSFGSGVAMDMSNRFPGLVIRQAVWDGVAPNVPEACKAAGIPPSQFDALAGVLGQAWLDCGVDADNLAARYDTPEKRRDYIRSYLVHDRVWREGDNAVRLAGEHGFDDAAGDFMAEAYADAGVFRSSLGFYEGAFSVLTGRIDEFETPLLDGPITTETLVLYGEEDELHREADWTLRMELGCANIVGPYTISRSGLWIPFEQPEVFNRTMAIWCRDVLC
jgi:pimeloyl-ACP methyl ester carboxylesterase